jgi:hypothetical protein
MRGGEGILAAFDELYDRACRARDGDAAAALFADDPDVTFWGSKVGERAVAKATSRGSTRPGRSRRPRPAGRPWISLTG